MIVAGNMSGRSKRFGPGHWRVLSVACMAVLLSGCGIFGDDDDEELAPAELLDFEETLDVRRVWSQKLGKGSEFLRIGLAPAGDGNRIYAASYDGNVSAYDPDSGKRIWRVETDTILSAGPGVGDDVVIVAGYDGDLIALRTDNGTEIWRINISGESLARPIVRNGEVAVYTIDGRLRVYSIFDGSQTWALEQGLPALTQRGSATPIVVGTSIISGFDNGRLIASSVTDGETLWEAILTPPAGRSDLDRLADVDGSMAAVGQDIYASGYNGRIASIAAESGELLWDREISTHVGVTADWNNVYAVGDQGEVIALLRQNGTDVWRQDGLLNREPTSPVVFGPAVVVGDFEGYVHFFSKSDGRPVARERVGKGMVSGVPVVIGDKLFVQSEAGVLAAFMIRTPEPKPNPATDSDATDEET